MLPSHEETKARRAMTVRKLLFNLIAAYIYHTPPHPGRGILGKLAWRIYPHEFVAEISDGVKMKVRLDRSEEILAWTRTFNPDDEVGVFLSQLKEGFVVLDIGANVGLVSLLAAKKVGRIGRVYAFEPVPDIFARLQENIALNSFNNIEPVPLALSSQKGTAMISVAGGASSLFRRVSDEFVEVPTERLDDFVEREGIERVDAIKLDVEGAELHVIRGADKTIRRFKPIMMVEINPDTLKAAGTTPQELFDAIVSYGYKAHVIRKGKAVPVTQPVKPKRRGIGIFFDDYLFLPIR
jgi:FkbM family methyltransferase